MNHSKSIDMFKSIYSSLVKKADDADTPLFKEQLDLLTNLIKTDMSSEDIRQVLLEKINRDRKNTDKYLTAKDRSYVNRRVYEEYLRLRSLTIITFIIMMSCILGFVATMFCMDLYISFTRDNDTIIKYIDFLKALKSE